MYLKKMEDEEYGIHATIHAGEQDLHEKCPKKKTYMLKRKIFLNEKGLAANANM